MTTPIKNFSSNIFVGQYCCSLDGVRFSIPSEWRYVFRDKGGIVVVALPDGRLVLATKKILEKSSNVEVLNAVYCKMDSRGRIIMPKVFRRMFKEVKNVVLCGSIHYVEVRGVKNIRKERNKQ